MSLFLFLFLHYILWLSLTVLFWCIFLLKMKISIQSFIQSFKQTSLLRVNRISHNAGVIFSGFVSQLYSPPSRHTYRSISSQWIWKWNLSFSGTRPWKRQRAEEVRAAAVARIKSAAGQDDKRAEVTASSVQDGPALLNHTIMKWRLFKRWVTAREGRGRSLVSHLKG